MSAATCSRTWEAEALEDGRLVGADRAAFDRHAAACASCQRELAELAALRETMKHLPAAEIAPLERQRQRAKLLRRANEHVVAPRARHVVRWAIALAAPVMVVTAIWIWQAGPTKSVAPVEQAFVTRAVEAPTFDVESVEDGRWEARIEGGIARVELTGGVASFAVHKLEGTQRFVVAVPDGEIEVRGTRFTVRVEEGQTRAVDVTEGRVSLRLRGHAEVLLVAGDRWPPAESSVPSPTPMAIAPAPAHVEPPASAKLAAPMPKASAARSIAALPSSALSAPPPAPPAPPAGERFDEAMGSFKVGAYARAEAQLARFLGAFPRDPRAEDASFLRAVARARLGDAAGAAALARTYLRLFPSGLRRLEAQRLADGAP